MLLIVIILVMVTVDEVIPQSRRGNRGSPRNSLQGREVVQLGFEEQSISVPGMSSVNVSLLEQTLIPTRSSMLASWTEQKVSDDMRLYLLKNTQVTCNDGTTAGYYIRETKTSKRWIIFL
ncbi:unnamed protein product [Ranitomeya imitator]|uniref:Uncharacterized protein n=2 Tax=Ranitomeya imitator TaxID=111125 RepID=A0ABN9LR31_9NEOB|nr:unnamed protein product [Ranitomeya imitator]